KIAFRVHDVSRIYRISWEQIEKPSEISSGQEAYAIGIIKLEDQISILLDFEKIVVEINPATGLNVERLEVIGLRERSEKKIVVEINPATGLNVERLEVLGPRERSEKKIVVAEDSPMLRELLKDTLNEAGYDQLTFFENGVDAWEYLEELSEDETIPLEQNVD